MAHLRVNMTKDTIPTVVILPTRRLHSNIKVIKITISSIKVTRTTTSSSRSMDMANKPAMVTISKQAMTNRLVMVDRNRMVSLEVLVDPLKAIVV